MNFTFYRFFFLRIQILNVKVSLFNQWADRYFEWQFKQKTKAHSINQPLLMPGKKKSLDDSLI